MYLQLHIQTKLGSWKWWYCAARNILLPWTLRNAKISRVVWISDCGCGRRREGAVRLFWWAQPITEWLVAQKCSWARNWLIFEAISLGWWASGNWLNNNMNTNLQLYCMPYIITHFLKLARFFFFLHHYLLILHFISWINY